MIFISFVEIAANSCIQLQLFPPIIWLSNDAASWSSKLWTCIKFKAAACFVARPHFSLILAPFCEAFQCRYQTITDFPESEQTNSTLCPLETSFPLNQQPLVCLVYVSHILSFPFPPAVTSVLTSENHPEEASQSPWGITQHEQLGFDSSLDWSNNPSFEFYSNQGTTPGQLAPFSIDNIFSTESHRSSLEPSDYQTADESIQPSVPLFDTTQNLDPALDNLQPFHPAFTLESESISQTSIPNSDTPIASTVSPGTVEGFIQSPSSGHSLNRFVYQGTVTDQ